MKVLELLEEFEEKLENLKAVPLTGKVVFDKGEFASLIQEIQLYLPDDIKHAKWIKDEREKILLEARKEADSIIAAARESEKKILSDAQSQMTHMVDQSTIVEQANIKGQEILVKAHSEATQIRDNSLEYADELIQNVLKNLTRVMGTLENNRKELLSYKNTK